MTTLGKRIIVTLRPEWEPELDQLKHDQFYDTSRAEMLRYIISLGLEAINSDSSADQAQKNSS